MDSDSSSAGVDGGLAAATVGHFENTRYANMVSVLYGGELGDRAGAVLDRRREGLEEVVEIPPADRAKRVAGLFPSLCRIPDPQGVFADGGWNDGMARCRLVGGIRSDGRSSRRGGDANGSSATSVIEAIVGGDARPIPVHE